MNGAVGMLHQILESKGPHTQVVATKGTCSRNRVADSFDAAVMNALDVNATLPRLRAEERPEWDDDPQRQPQRKFGLPAGSGSALGASESTTRNRASRWIVMGDKPARTSSSNFA